VVLADAEDVHAHALREDPLLNDIADDLGLRKPGTCLIDGDVAEGIEAEDCFRVVAHVAADYV
jgi:hypothetical protein